MNARFRIVALVAVLASALGACELAFPTHPLGDTDASTSCPSTCANATTIETCKQVQSSCPLGCTTDVTLGARCRDVDPFGVADPSNYSNATGDTTWTDAGVGPDGAPGSIVIDTGSGTITAGATTIRPAGSGVDSASGISYALVQQLQDARLPNAQSPELGVFGFRSLTIGKGVTVTFIGTPAVALLAATDFTVDGTITIRCNGTTAGSGGFGGDKGPCPGVDGVSCGSTCTPTSSGAGFATKGGDGLGGNKVTAVGGAPFPSFDGGVFVLFGGSGGGGTNTQNSTPSGGSGGGGLQLVAGHAFTLNGIIDACGCSPHPQYFHGGGGAGGMIDVESPSVTIAATAIIAANGGSGGTVDGKVGAAQAQDQFGGWGGALDGDPGNSYGGGGGGGSAGRVVIGSSVAPTLAGVISPAPIITSINGK